MKSVLKYPGSKWNIVDKLVNMIPEHHTYLEPFFGSGAVFFTKQPSDIEMINDLDDDIPNLFRCIRDDSEKLPSLVAATPFSRYEYDNAFKTDIFEIMMPDEPFHKARRFLIRCWQGHGFRTNGYKVGWKNDVHGRESMYALRDWYNLPERILKTAERLRCVQVDNRPAVEIIQRFNYEDVFMYIDPPYLWKTRKGKQYKHEMSDEDHIELLTTLKNSKAKIMISGYDSELYNELLHNWNKEYLMSNAEHGKPREEVVWMNYKRQLTLLDFEKDLKVVE